MVVQVVFCLRRELLGDELNKCKVLFPGHDDALDVAEVQKQLHQPLDAHSTVLQASYINHGALQVLD